MPADRPDCVEQRILEQAARLTPDGAVTAWAALRWRGGGFFDGLEQGGRAPLPVPLLLGPTASLRPHASSQTSKEQLPPWDRQRVAGLEIATAPRAVFDEIRRRGSLWAGVEAVDMAAAAKLVSVEEFAEYVGLRTAWTGVPLARKVAALASDDSRSPRETWLRLVWVLIAGLAPPLCNHPVYDLDGRLLGTPDLLDPVAGLVGEYNGAEHREQDRRRFDLTREERFRDHGLEYFEVVRGDSRDVAATRLLNARARARFLPPDRRPWTLRTA